MSEITGVRKYYIHERFRDILSKTSPVDASVVDLLEIERN